MSKQDHNQTTVATFDANADQYLAYFKTFTLYRPSFDRFMAALSLQQKTLLELGCGPGNVSHYLLKKRPDLKIHGLDLAPRMVALAQELNPAQKYEVMDCRQLQKLSGSYDAVMAAFCLPYLNHQEAQDLLTESAELLQPGGVIYLSTIEGLPADDGFQQSGSAEGSTYVYHHDIQWLSGLLETLGFNLLWQDSLAHVHNKQTTKDHFWVARKT